MSDINERLAFNQALIEEFRANDGKVEGAFANAPLLLLTTTGAKSGEPREVEYRFADSIEHLESHRRSTERRAHPTSRRRPVTNGSTARLT